MVGKRGREMEIERERRERVKEMETEREREKGIENERGNESKTISHGYV